MTGPECPAGVSPGDSSGGVAESSPQADKTKAPATMTNVAAARIRPMDYIVATRCAKFEPVPRLGGPVLAYTNLDRGNVGIRRIGGFYKIGPKKPITLRPSFFGSKSPNKNNSGAPRRLDWPVGSRP